MDKVIIFLQEMWQGFIHLLTDFVDWFFSMLKSMFYWCIDQILSFAHYLFERLAYYMPDMSDFCSGCFAPPDIDAVVLGTGGVMAFARWVLPIDVALCLSAFTLIVIGLDFTFGIVLRWAKVSR